MINVVISYRAIPILKTLSSGSSLPGELIVHQKDRPMYLKPSISKIQRLVENWDLNKILKTKDQNRDPI